MPKIKAKESEKKSDVKVSDGVCPECTDGKLENEEVCSNCDGTGRV